MSTVLALVIIASSTPAYTIVPKVEAIYTTLSLEKNVSQVKLTSLITTGVFMWKGQEVEHLSIKTPNTTTWLQVEEDHDGKEHDQLNTYYSQMLFLEPTDSIQVQIPKGITDLTFVSFREGWNIQLIGVPAVSASDLPSFVVSRKDWGADPAWIEEDTWQVERAKVCASKPEYCGSSPEGEKAVEEKAKKLQESYPEDTKIASKDTTLNGKELHWNISHSAHISKLFVHHTAELTKDVNGDGKFDIEDEKTIMRNTYYFHSLVRGWGDIGYNFVVGQSGTVYEGRAGGSTAVGAHAVWRNISSIGISTMGNFEEEDVLTPQFTGLANILGYLSKKYSLDPTGTTTFYGKNDYVILGHRDSPEASTACPGKNLYEKLPTLRILAQKAQSSQLVVNSEPTENANISTNGISASFVPLEKDLTFSPKEQKEITLQVKNTGKVPWEKGTKVRIPSIQNEEFHVLSGEGSPLSAYSIANNVAPGETVSLKLKLEAQYRAFNGNMSVSLLINKNYSTTPFILPVIVKNPNLSYEVLTIVNPKKELIYNESSKALLIVKNTGDTTWSNDTMTIATTETGKVPVTTGEAKLRETTVLPNATGTFEIGIRANETSGSYTITATVQSIYNDSFQGKNATIAGTVVHPAASKSFSLEQVDASVLSTVQMGETSIVSLHIKNTSAESWYSLSSMNIMPVLDKNIPITLLQTPIHLEKDTLAPGEITSLQIPVRSGYGVTISPQIALNYLGAPLLKNQAVLPIKINDATLSGEFFGQGRIENSKLSVDIQNTGTASWKKELLTLVCKDDSGKEHILAQMKSPNSAGEKAIAHFESTAYAPCTSLWFLRYEKSPKEIRVSGAFSVKKTGIDALEFGRNILNRIKYLPLFKGAVSI